MRELYDYICGIRAVTSVDGMTADFYKFNHKDLVRNIDKNS